MRPSIERRAFLRGLGAASGAAALAIASPRASWAAARARPFDRLRHAGIDVAARVGRWDGARASFDEVPLAAAGPARRALAAGTLSVQATMVAAAPDAVDVAAGFTVRGAPLWATVGLRLRLAGWSRDAYVVLPGACYAGNRFESRYLAYPPLLTEPADIGPNVPPIVTDIPRLNCHPGDSGISELAADLASPATALFLPDRRLGVVVLVDPATAIGRTGIVFEESADRSAAAVSIGAPFAYERSRASGAASGTSAASGGAFGGGRGHTANVHPGTPVAVRARVYVFDCADVPALFARLFAVRKALTGATERVHELPFSAAFAAHEERVNRRWVEAPGFYATGARDSAYSTWQTGWCGGLATTVPLFAAGAARSRERARRTIALVAGDGQAPSGFFHAVSDGKTWYEDGFAAPLPRRAPAAPSYRHAQRWHLVRRTADTLHAAMKQLALVDRRPAGEADRPPAELAPAARRAADALQRLWERYHQLGQFVDVESGDLIVGGSSSAGIAPAALALASVKFNHDPYLRVARAAAEQYHDRYVRAGVTCGGPGDALQCPDGESAAALLESFVTLYEVTREAAWLDRARAAAHLAASWVVSYEPQGDEAGVARELRATGAVLGDAQNGRAAPGYLLSSGDALFRLYRATGDVALLELLRDTAHGLAQHLRAAEKAAAAAPAAVGAGWRPDGDGARTDPRRWLAEPSEIVPAANVLDTIALLTYTEVPGLYAQVDKGFLFVFDHVDARIKERLAGKLMVTLSNPTRAAATVRMLAESSADAAVPLPPGAILDAPTAVVPAGGAVDVLLPPGISARR
jgi:hypothetical protein